MGASSQIGCLASTAEVERSPAPGADRRAFVRIAASEVPWIKGARLRYGPSLSLIDVSPGGAQVESAVRLKPGSTIVVEIQGLDQDLTVTSRVVRCQIAALRPLATYRGALAFAGGLQTPGLGGAGTPLDAAHELARLALALKRLRTAQSDRELSEARRTSITRVGQTALGTAAIALEFASATRGGAALSNQLACVFREVTRGIDDGDSSAALLERIDQRLWHAAGVRIGIDDGGNTAAKRQNGAVYFDVPATGGRPPVRLLVDLVRDSKPTEMQFQLLKSAAHLCALARELDPPQPGRLDRPDDAEAVPDAARPDAAVASVEAGIAQGPCKVVVRYADGRMLKGYTSDFLAAKRHFHLVTGPGASRDEAVTVLIGQVKAVFFVRDFDGDADRVEGKAFEHNTGGRRVAVTFLDDEQLVGTTLNYRPDGIGFFVVPADPRSNNQRIFVVSQAVRLVRFM